MGRRYWLDLHDYAEEATKQTQALAEKAADAIERKATPERQADGTPTSVKEHISIVRNGNHEHHRCRSRAVR